MGTQVPGRSRGRRGVVLAAGLLVVLGVVGIWIAVGRDMGREGVQTATTPAPTETPTPEALFDSPRVSMPTPAPVVAAKTPTATVQTPTPSTVGPTPTMVGPAPTAPAVVPAITPASASPTPTPTPLVVITEVSVHRDGPGVGFQECYASYFEWGPRSDYATVAWSPDGSELYFTDGGIIYGVTTDGSRVWRIASARPSDAGSIQGRVGAWTSFAVAPDGAHLAYTRCLAWSAEVRKDRLESMSRVRQRRGVTYIERVIPQFADRYFELFRVRRDGSGVERLTENGDNIDFYPAWSPDGRRIAFLSDAEVTDRYANALRMRLYTMAADGTDVQPTLSDEFAMLHQPPQWSPDGRHLAVVRYIDKPYPGGITLIGRELYVVGLDGSAPRRVATDVVSGPSWSSDGERLAYARANDEGVALYTVGLDGADERWITDIPSWRGPKSESLATEAWIDTVAWSPDGTRILVRSDHGSPAFVAGVESGNITELGSYRALAAAWSPTGSRVALLALGQHEGEPSVLVATLAPGGTDVRVLAGQVLPYDEHAPWQALSSGPVVASACAAGVVVPDPDANPELVNDCLALVEIQGALAGGSDLYWSAERPITGWEGVEVTGTPPRVRALALGSRGLRGAVPTALQRLTALRELDLSHNELTGEISSTVDVLPRLTRLDLGHNQLRGTIPSTLDKYPTLTFLDLSGNQLSGPIPQVLGHLTNLRFLGLASNKLTGPIPPELGQLIHLTDLVLSDNALTGSIPIELTYLEQMRSLYLWGNELTGEIPAELARLEQLQVLYLEDNRLVGPIPTELAELPGLYAVGLRGNQFSGCVPPGLPLTDRDDLDLPTCEPAM